MLIETHAHIDDKQFDTDRDEVIQRAFSGGVEKIINIGAGLGSSQRSVVLAEKYENIFCSIGLHPHYFMEYGEKSFNKIDEFKALSLSKKVVAIGEIGLDCFIPDGSTITEVQKELQKKGFTKQLEFAKELKLPVILHCRGSRPVAPSQYREADDAYEDVFAIVSQFPELNFVWHSFGGQLSFTEKVLAKENMLFSFAGNITYSKPGAEIFSVIKLIPIERIMLETDCPYLAPVPMRGKRNEPLYVKYVAQKIAEVKNLELGEVAKITTSTAERFFKL
ncbi:MAG: TatD family hydrolase [Candidatus Moranbacteria bacterium]|nr:TatD family hydrolase [Candidatus Moranbacteria bacterium]